MIYKLLKDKKRFIPVNSVSNIFSEGVFKDIFWDFKGIKLFYQP